MSEFVVERLRALRRTPGMWAYTREAFAAQVALLLELVGAPQHEVYKCFTQSTNGGLVAAFVEKVDDEWAHALVDQAAALAGLTL